MHRHNFGKAHVITLGTFTQRLFKCSCYKRYLRFCDCGSVLEQYFYGTNLVHECVMEKETYEQRKKDFPRDYI